MRYTPSILGRRAFFRVCLSRDPTGNTIVASELPKSSGQSAWATGIVYADGDANQPIICGYTGTTFVNGGSLRAVIWRRNSTVLGPLCRLTLY